MNKHFYRLTAYSNPLEMKPSFLIPIFRRNHSFFVQEINDNSIVAAFNELDRDRFPYRVRLLRYANPWLESDEAIYGYIFGNGEVVFGTKVELAEIFRERTNELMRYPFAYSEVLNFLEDTDKKTNGILRTRNVLSFIDRDIADTFARVELRLQNLQRSHEQVEQFIANTLQFADSDGFINHWDLFGEIYNLIVRYGQVYITLKRVRSLIGTTPKVRNAIRAMSFRSVRIGAVSAEIALNFGNLKTLKAVDGYVLITQARVVAEHHLIIKACDTLSIQKHYFKKDFRKVTKGKNRRDYVCEVIEADRGGVFFTVPEKQDPEHQKR